MKMKYIVFCFFLISNITHAQIDYSYFKQTWCKCMPDSGAVETDTITYRIESEACKTKRYDETHLYIERLEYTFENKHSVHVYESSSVGLRSDEVPEVKSKITFKYYALGDTIGVDSTYEKIYPGKSGGYGRSVFGYGRYQLNKKENTLTIIYDENVNEYKILFLSSKMFVIRKINHVSSY